MQLKGATTMTKTVTPLNHFFLKNRMLIANMASNIVGVLIINLISISAITLTEPEIAHLAFQIDFIFSPFAFIIGILLALQYERPIRHYLNLKYRNKSIADAIAVKARQRLLNAPFFLIGMDFIIWFIAAIFYPALFWYYGATQAVVIRAFFHSLLTGFITITIAFFILEYILQRRLAPLFFPDGGLYMTPRTMRIRIRTRLIALIFACNLVPFLVFLFMLTRTYCVDIESGRLLEYLRDAILFNSILFMAIGLLLTFLVSGNLTRPLKEIIRVLQGVQNGDFNKKVRVTSNDEIGYTGDVINEMASGLKDRDFIKDVFGKYVTKEIMDEILSGNLSLDGEIKEVTVLFADLRNFTPMVEATPPQEVVRIINRYFTAMADVITQHHGLILQYIGDEIEAVFGAPVHRDDHPLMAIQAAQEMSRRLKDVNRELERNGYKALAHGIGVHTGEVLAGNIGSPERLSYALVGDTVNLTSRLQGLNKQFGTEIIISAAACARLDHHFNLKALPPTLVKGKSQPVEIFTLE